jgi:tetratricopeptide (TPR) repeat protein
MPSPRLLPLILGGFLTLAALARAAEDRIEVPGSSINGTPVRLVFDTGAGTGVLLWRTAADRLGLELVPEPEVPDAANGRVHLSVTEPVQVTLMGQSFGESRLGVYDAPKDLAMDFDGVLGWAAGRKNILVLRGVEKSLAFAPAVPKAAAHWARYRVQPDLPTLELTPLGGRNRGQTLSIDTGDSGGVSLPAHAWDLWRAAHPHAPVTIGAYYMPGAGLVVAEEAWADKLSIGGLTLTAVPIRKANVAEKSTAGSSVYAGTLGLAALARIDLVVDGRNSLAYVNPRKDPPAPYAHNRLGAVFAPEDLFSDPLLAHVIKGGPAYQAGIRDGDVLIQIDALNVTTWRTEPAMTQLLHEWWERPAGSVSLLTLQRGTQTYTTRVVLRNLIGPDLPDPTHHALVADVSVYDLWIRLEPNDTFALARRAFLRVKSHDYAGAIADDDRLIALLPNNAAAYANRANAKLLSGDDSGAVADYDRAIALNPKDADSLANRAYLREQLHGYDEAIRDYDTAVSVNPNDPALLYQRARAEANHGQFAAAIADYSRVLALHPEDRFALTNRAGVKVRQGDFVGASIDYAAVVGVRPDGAYRERLLLALDLRRLHLDDASAGLDMQAQWRDPWLRTVAAFLAGTLPEADFLAQADAGTPAEAAAHRSQAAYYAGMAHLLADDPDGASEFFTTSVAGAPPESAETALARAELGRLAAAGPAP